MKRRAVMVGAVLIVAAGAATAQTNTKWVERTKADVRAGKGSFHDIVDTVLKGEQVQVLQTDDKWLSVKTPRGKTGWMFEKALSAPIMPTEAPTSTLPEITACWVSPLPCV